MLCTMYPFVWRCICVCYVLFVVHHSLAADVASATTSVQAHRKWKMAGKHLKRGAKQASSNINSTTKIKRSRCASEYVTNTTPYTLCSVLCGVNERMECLWHLSHAKCCLDWILFFWGLKQPRLFFFSGGVWCDCVNVAIYAVGEDVVRTRSVSHCQVRFVCSPSQHHAI